MPFRNAKKAGIPPAGGGDSTAEKGQVMAGAKADLSPSDRLRLAAGKGDVKSVSDLLDQGISSDKDKDGRTLLHIAAQNGHVDVVRALVAKGFDTSAKDTHGYTPLHRAAAQGHLEVAEFLVKYGCPVDEEDEFGNTALHAAAWNGYSQTIDLVLRNKARVNVVNKVGFTALHSAAQKGHNQSARVLLFAGCQPNIKNKYGETALHTSARYGHAGVARILLSAKCKVNIQNKNGETGLHVSVTCKRQKIAKLLVDAGIKKKLKNKQGETALEIARKMNDLEMILVLTSEEKTIAIRRHRSEDIRPSAPAEDTMSDTKSDSSRRRRDSHSRQEIDKENYQTIGSCTAGPAAASAKAAKSGVATAPSKAMTASNRLLFDGTATSKKLLDGFKQHKIEKMMKPLPDAVAADKHGKKEKLVNGLHSEYGPKPGQTYYRDLSGKVKQGPVGCTSGGPTLQRPERKNSADNVGLYEPVALEKCCHRRISSQPVAEQGRGRNSCTTLSRAQKSTVPIEGRRSRVQSEPRLSGRSRQFADVEHRPKGQLVQEVPCDCCHGNAAVQTVARRGTTPDVDTYGLVQSGYTHGVTGRAAENFSPQGRFFRSGSDETLSRHPTHRRHRQSVRQQRTEIPAVDASGDRYWTMSKVNSRARDVNRDRTYETLRSRPSFQTRNESRPYTYHEESDYVLPSALRSDHIEHVGRGFPTRSNRPLASNPASTAKERVEEAYQNYNEVFDGSKERLNSSEIVYGSRLICNDIPSASKPGLPLLQSSPFVAEEGLSATVGVLQSCPCIVNPLPVGPCHPIIPATSPVCTACQHENFCSLQSASNHPRADAGSNPDSGYGSKSYRTRGDPIVALLRPLDSHSSGRESKQSREDDKNSHGSSHWNTSECTVAPRLPNPGAAMRPSECRQTQSTRKSTAHRQSLKEITSPSRLSSANREPMSPQHLHHASSKDRVVAGRCPSERPASWCSHHPEPSRFTPNQTQSCWPAEVYNTQCHQGASGGVIMEGSDSPRPVIPSEHHDRLTNYHQYEPIVARQARRSSNQPVQPNDGINAQSELKYIRQHSERDARQGGNRKEARDDLRVVRPDGLNATGRHTEEFCRTNGLQDRVCSPVEPSNRLQVQAQTHPLNQSSQRQPPVEIGRSTTV